MWCLSSYLSRCKINSCLINFYLQIDCTSQIFFLNLFYDFMVTNFKTKTAISLRQIIQDVQLLRIIDRKWHLVWTLPFEFRNPRPRSMDDVGFQWQRHAAWKKSNSFPLRGFRLGLQVHWNWHSAVLTEAHIKSCFRPALGLSGPGTLYLLALYIVAPRLPVSLFQADFPTMTFQNVRNSADTGQNRAVPNFKVWLSLL